MRPLCARAGAGALILLGSTLGRAQPAPRRASAPPDRQSPDVQKYVLRPAADGSYLYEGQEFQANIAPDGTVSFRDKRWSARSHLGEGISGRAEGGGPRREEWPAP